MVLSIGDKIHVITRRQFEQEARRHFVGTIEKASDAVARVSGYVFVWSNTLNQFERRPERRTRIVALGDAGNVVNLLPAAVDIEKVRYELSPEKRLVLTDGSGFALDLNRAVVTGYHRLVMERSRPEV